MSGSLNNFVEYSFFSLTVGTIIGKALHQPFKPLKPLKYKDMYTLDPAGPICHVKIYVQGNLL